MKFPKFALAGAGILGVIVLAPLYWLFDFGGRTYSPPTDYPHVLSGVVSVAMACQIALLAVTPDPLRFRPWQVPSILEKFGYFTAAAVFYSVAGIPALNARGAMPDLLLGLLCVVAVVKTRRHS